MVRRQTNFRKEKKREREGKEKRKTRRKKSPRPTSSPALIASSSSYYSMKSTAFYGKGVNWQGMLLTPKRIQTSPRELRRDRHHHSSPIIIDPPVRSGPFKETKLQTDQAEGKKRFVPILWIQPTKQAIKQEPLTHHQNKNPVFFHFF
jgi:hypothetical protein